RLLRDSPLNSIWEGSGNVIALDVLRALARAPDAADALFDEAGQARGADRGFDRALDGAHADLARLGSMDRDDAEREGRRVAERLALVLQGSLVIRHAPPAVAGAFIASRLDGEGLRSLGTLPSDAGLGSIIERHRPLIA